MKDLAALQEKLLREPSLTSFLRAVQAELNWIPREAMELAAEHFQTTYMQVYEQAAFSPGFCLEERGERVIEVCQGLACREAGSSELLKAIETISGLKTGETSGDGKLSLCRQVCFGRCAIGPNVRIQNLFFAGQGVEQAQVLVDHART